MEKEPENVRKTDRDSYAGRGAELYDIFYGDKPYAEEAAFVHYCLREYGRRPTGSVLELACGTGSHAFELEKLGYRVAATDRSDSMLAVAREKASRLSSRVEFYSQDMRALNLKKGPFDAAICLFDSIGHVVTNEALAQALHGVHSHLGADGLLVLEFWNAAATLRNYEPVRVRRWATEKGSLLRISETTIDHVRQTCTIRHSIFELNSDGTYSESGQMHTVRYFLVQEMAAILQSNRFTPLKWFAGFTTGEDITDNTWHIVSIARKC